MPAERPNLWPHQTRAVEAVVDAQRAGFRRILLAAPTGGGKTLVMQMLAETRCEAREKRHATLGVSIRHACGLLNMLKFNGVLAVGAKAIKSIGRAREFRFDWQIQRRKGHEEGK